jgi:hypothetical protein
MGVPKKSRRNKLLSLAGVLFASGCLVFAGYIVYRERDVLTTHLLKMNVRQLLAVTGWYLMDLAIYVSGWIAIITSLGGRIGVVHHVRIYCLANAAKRLPGTLWYVGGRAALYGRMGVPARTVVTASAIEGALIWLSGLAVSVPILMVVMPERRWIWLSLGVLLLIGILNPKTLRWILARAARDGGSPRMALLPVYGWLLLYMAGWGVGGVLLAAVVSLFAPLPIGQLPFVIGTWTVAGTASMLAIFLPSNFGVTEVTLTALLSRLVPVGVAILVAISIRLLTTLLDVVLGGLAYSAGVICKAQ